MREVDESLDRVIKETYLTRKPREGSGWVAALSMTMLFLISVAYWQNSFRLSSQLEAIPERVFIYGEYWRLMTAIVVHADVRHLLSNGLVFGVLSYLIYGYFGFTAYPLLAILLGMVVNALTLLSYPPDTRLLGASGVVYLMAAFWLTSYVLIERRLSMAKRLLRAVGFSVIVLLPSGFVPGVSYRSHGIGFFLGLLWGWFHFRLKKNEIRGAEVATFE